jgi:type IV secretory pathway VirD2 relaxase
MLGAPMSTKGDNPFTPRPGRIRSGESGGRAKTYLSRMTKALSASGGARQSGLSRRPSPALRGGRRRVIVKARIVRMSTSSAAALMAHVAYIKRDAALSEQDRGRVFDRDSEDAGTKDFVDAVSADRHHFRFIISPEDGAEMADLKPFVRDLVSQIEKDLETRLEWVSAIHHDTGRPHAHLIIRGKREDGKDLVMPREYISHGIRERTEGLVTLELGPETAFEQERKLNAEATVERLTRIDHFLDRQAGEDHLLELKNSPPKYRTLHAARLRTLERLGLAEKLGAGRWQLDAKFKATLKSLGERGDIIKTMNRALAGTSGRRLDPDAIFDRADPDGRSVSGSVLQMGLTGEAHDRAYAIIDGLDGRAVYTELGGAEQLAEIRRGAIVTLSPPDLEPKPSDVTIDRIARKHGGTYSAGLHQADDPRASPAFIAAHVRRLEALRRQGHVERSADANWTVPAEYLAKVRVYERTQARLRSLAVLVHSEMGLAEQSTALGVTWLDEAPSPSGVPLGFGREVTDAQVNRRAFLAEIGIAANDGKALTQAQRMELMRRDLAQAGRRLSEEIGKPYSPAPTRGHVDGIYREPVSRVSGKFAVIERSQDFTIVPWREVMERSRGMSVSGMMRGGSVSWKLSRGIGMSD